MQAALCEKVQQGLKNLRDKVNQLQEFRKKIERIVSDSSKGSLLCTICCHDRALKRYDHLHRPAPCRGAVPLALVRGCSSFPVITVVQTRDSLPVLLPDTCSSRAATPIFASPA